MVVGGIEDMNVFGGSVYLDVMDLVEHRGLDAHRFSNLLMKQKAVALPCEDPVTFGVNAAKPIIDSLKPAEVDRIELLITCSESGIDFGKSLSTYIHDYLGLNRNCRAFELKQACYSGSAGLQMALNFIFSQTSPGAMALVVATDISRFIVEEGGNALSQEWSYAEPTTGAGAAAMLISENPHVYQADRGANGYYTYEVMDTCRPTPDSEGGNADLSLLSYLDCCENAFLEYRKRVEAAEYGSSFNYLAFHTPFGGMVKGAHRTMMRKLAKASPQQIDEDFRRRVLPGLEFCQRVGNSMGATVFFSLASTICNGNYDAPKRIGCFSYGSGCCSEFYSGVVTKRGAERLARHEIQSRLDARYRLTLEEYERLLRDGTLVRFGTRNIELDTENMPVLRKGCSGQQRLVLKRIKEFHREYEWVG
jgi:polyketide biosynthesis 3-hydroxy-3-methylglutaryl-CoA synthase-like enzyme PksG